MRMEIRTIPKAVALRQSGSLHPGTYGLTSTVQPGVRSVTTWTIIRGVTADVVLGGIPATFDCALAHVSTLGLLSSRPVDASTAGSVATLWVLRNVRASVTAGDLMYGARYRRDGWCGVTSSRAREGAGELIALSVHDRVVEVRVRATRRPRGT